MQIKSSAPEHAQGRALALGHLKHRAPEKDREEAASAAAVTAPPVASAPAPKAEAPVGPAAIVELGRSEPAPGTYAAPGPRPVETAEGARIQTNVKIKERVAGEDHGGEPGQWTLAEDSSLKINMHVDTLVGSGPGTNIVLEEGAKLMLNEHVGRLTAGESGGTIVVGEGASLHLNIHADAATTGGTVVVADGMDVHMDVHSHQEMPGPVISAAPPAPAEEAPATAPEESPAPKAAPVEPRARAAPPAKKVSKKDEQGDVRDLRWHLLRDIVESFRRQQVEWAARNDQAREEGHGKGKALGHVHKKVG